MKISKKEAINIVDKHVISNVSRDKDAQALRIVTALAKKQCEDMCLRWWERILLGMVFIYIWFCVMVGTIVAVEELALWLGR